MKNSFKGYFFALLILIITFPSRLYANHIIGADITWKHYSADTFLFTASVYRSCTGMKLTNSPFSYFGTAAGYTKPISILGTMDVGLDVTPGNYGGCDQCSDPNCTYPFGTQLIKEEVKIAFSPGCCDWFVSWQQNYRDGSINTGPGGETFYIEAEINTCLARPDNSPTFNTPANNIFCINQCNNMDNSATDIDSTATIKPDSLVYRIVSPLQAHGKPVNYSKGYSYLEPMIVQPIDSPSCKGFFLDNQTGILTFKPKLQEISVMAIEVDEWRVDINGIYQKIGSVRRDIETYISTNCPITISPTAPVIQGINGGNSFSEQICGGAQQVCFDIKAFDLTPNDTAKMSWNNPPDMKGATFTDISHGARWPIADFCWNPKDSFERTQPYNFIVTVWSVHKPYDSVTKTFSIYVVPPPKAIYSAIPAACGMVNFSAKPDPNSTSIENYEWEAVGNPGYNYLLINGQTGSYQYFRKGWYRYYLNLKTANNCYANYTDSVFVNPTLEISLPKDSIVCAKSPYVNLRPDILLGTSPLSYLWNTGETSQSKSALITRDTSFKVTITDPTGCSVSDTTSIIFQNPPPQKPATIVYKCAQAGVSLNATNISSQLTWTAIINGKMIPNFADSNPITVNDSGIYIAMAKNSTICPGSDSFKVRTVPDTVYNQNYYLCYGETLGLEFSNELVWIDSGANNSWVPVPITGNNPTSIIIHASNYHEYKIKTFGSNFIHNIYCNDTSYKNYFVDSLNPHLLKSPFPEICIYDRPLNLNTIVNPDYKGGYWTYSYNSAAIQKDSILYPAIMGTTSNDTNLGNIYYQLNSFTCQLKAKTRIIIWPKVYAGPAVSIWKECGKYILNNQNVTPQYGGKWTVIPGTPVSCLEYSGDTVLFNPDAVSGNGKYGFVYTYINKADTAACSGSDTVYITLIAKPVIRIGHIDTLCTNASPSQINVNPPGGYFEFTDSTNKAAIQNSLIYPNIAGPGYHRVKYVLKSVSGNPACTDTAEFGFYVMKVPDPSFTTEDSNSQYCVSHGPVKLIPKTPGGIFIGATFTRRDTAYFDPSKQAVDTIGKLIPVNYYLPFNNGLCSEVYTQYIYVEPNAVFKIISDTLLCSNNGVFTIQAAAVNYLGYYWSSPDASGQDAGTIQSQSRSGSFLTVNYVPGAAQLKQKFFTIYLTGWGKSGCDTVHTQLTIHIKPGPQPDFRSRPLQGCDPVDEHFTNLSYDSSSVITKYEWNFGDGTPDTNTVNPSHVYHSAAGDSIGFYFVSLTATSADGCSKTFTSPSASVIVYADPVPIISAVPNFTTLDLPRIRFGLSPQSLWIDPNDSSNIYLWHFIPQGLDTGGYSTLARPVHIYKDTGKYTVTLKISTSNGCDGTDSAIAVVDIRPAFAIFIPNIFLPGSRFDANKTFKPVISSYTKFNMTISSRWGNLVYYSNDPNPGWDGHTVGGTAPADVYVYKIEVSDLYGRTYQYIGNVTLMR